MQVSNFHLLWYSVRFNSGTITHKMGISLGLGGLSWVGCGHAVLDELGSIQLSYHYTLPKRLEVAHF